MISKDKIMFLMQLLMSEKEATVILEQALKLEDQEKTNELKRNLMEINEEVEKNL